MGGGEYTPTCPNLTVRLSIFFYKGPLNNPRPFGGVRYNDYLCGLNNIDMKNFLKALVVGYVVVGVFNALTKKN